MRKKKHFKVLEAAGGSQKRNAPPQAQTFGRLVCSQCPCWKATHRDKCWEFKALPYTQSALHFTLMVGCCCGHACP